MRINALVYSVALAPIIVSCAVQPVSLAPVGSGPIRNAVAASGAGNLEVYSQTTEFDEDDESYFPHTDYQIYARNGKRLERVWNHQNHEDEAPAIVALPAGDYVIKAWAEIYGLVSVPVVITPNQTTRVFLQPGWKPRRSFVPSQLVQMPNGYYVGWRAET